MRILIIFVLTIGVGFLGVGDLFSELSAKEKTLKTEQSDPFFTTAGNGRVKTKTKTQTRKKLIRIPRYSSNPPLSIPNARYVSGGAVMMGGTFVFDTYEIEGDVSNCESALNTCQTEAMMDDDAVMECIARMCDISDTSCVSECEKDTYETSVEACMIEEGYSSSDYYYDTDNADWYCTQ